MSPAAAQRVIVRRMDITPQADADPSETTGWIEFFDEVIRDDGAGQVRFLLACLVEYGYRHSVVAPLTANTPYVNTIPFFLGSS